MRRILFIIGIFLFWAHTHAYANIWERLPGDVQDASALGIIEHERVPEVICGIHKKGIFTYDEAEPQWRLSMPLPHADIYAISFDHQNNDVFVCSSTGVYRSINEARSWTRYFFGKNAAESACRALVVLPYGTYVATEAGVFVTRDHGRTFVRESAGAPVCPAYMFAASSKNPDVFYAAAKDGLYRCANSGTRWERVRVKRDIREEDVLSADDAVAEEPAEREESSSVACAGDNPRMIYYSNSAGIVKSDDGGLSWQSISMSGMTGGGIVRLYLSQEMHVYCLAEKGLYVSTDDKTWNEVNIGSVSGKVNAMTEDASGRLYIATENGVFWSMGSGDHVTKDDAGMTGGPFVSEPSIRDMQDAAIRYADVAPEKILQWRSKAARRAVLPKLSIGFDRDSGDLWHWEGGSTTKEEDDCLRKGKATVDWGVSLSWDLSELVWSADQTSIDVRSRLMVELRNSILDEVTKLYFERKRLIGELDGLSIDDRKKRHDKELKIEELGASLDALTGGYFSRRR
jgi:photosystem II stability/assembly factor-like uncharacterized protein